MPKADSVSTPSGAERRKSPRADCVVAVDYGTVDDFFSEFARNINEGGLFVETEKPHAIGTLVSLQFRIPGTDEPVESSGRVVRIASGSDGPPGMGIEFENLDDGSRQKINELVRSLRSAPAPLRS